MLHSGSRGGKILVLIASLLTALDPHATNLSWHWTLTLSTQNIWNGDTFFLARKTLDGTEVWAGSGNARGAWNKWLWTERPLSLVLLILHQQARDIQSFINTTRAKLI